MRNANQMVSSESSLAPAALPRDHRSEFGYLSHPWYYMGICYWHRQTVVRALGTTSQTLVGLQPALGLRLHPVPALSPPFFNSTIWLWALPWRNEELLVPSATTQKLRKGCECSWDLLLPGFTTVPTSYVAVPYVAGWHADTPWSSLHPEPYTGSGTKCASAFSICFSQDKALYPEDCLYLSGSAINPSVPLGTHLSIHQEAGSIRFPLNLNSNFFDQQDMVKVYGLDAFELWGWCFWTVVLRKTLKSPLNCK